MKKTIVIVALTLVIVGGTIYTMISNKKNDAQNSAITQPSDTSNEQNSSPAVSAPKVETVTVTYDDNGFSPQNIEISKGSTVNFVNKSSIPLWVASNPHPEHTDYPEFDTPRATGDLPKLGEDFSFVFEKSGVWEYHSHTASGDVGPAVVHPGTVTVK